MSTFIKVIENTVSDLTTETSAQIHTDGTVLAATPAAVLAGGAVVTSALLAYAVEEAGDK